MPKVGTSITQITTVAVPVTDQERSLAFWHVTGLVEKVVAPPLLADAYAYPITNHPIGVDAVVEAILVR